MRAGLLRHRVDLQSLTRETNEFGELIATPSTYATRVPAFVKPLQGNELWNAQQVQAEIAYDVRIRYRADVEPSHQITWGDRTLEVITVINTDGRNRESVLLCKETT